MCWRLGAELPCISHHGIALNLLAAAMTDGVANNTVPSVYQVTQPWLFSCIDSLVKPSPLLLLLWPGQCWCQVGGL